MVLGAYTGNIIEQAEQPDRWYWGLIQVILFNKQNILRVLSALYIKQIKNIMKYQLYMNALKK